MSTYLDYFSADDTPNDNQQSYECGGVTFNIAKFTLEEAREQTEGENVINAVLGLVGLSIESPAIGELDGLDIHNFSAVDALKVALMEGVKESTLYDIQILEDGTPSLYTIDVDEATGIDVWMNVLNDVYKPPPAVVVRGNDPLPYMELLDTISLIDKGAGPEVEVESWGEYGMGEVCGNKIYNYYGCISYKDPHFERTTHSDLESTLDLKSYETLVGVIYTVIKPDDVDISFDSTTLKEVHAILYSEDLDEQEKAKIEQEHPDLINIAALAAEYEGWDNTSSGISCKPCVRLKPEQLIDIFDTDYSILGVDKVILKGAKFEGIQVSISESTGSCYSGDSTIQGDVTTTTCEDVNLSEGFFTLTEGTDFMYDVSSTLEDVSAYSRKINKDEDVTYSLKVGVPYTTTDTALTMTTTTATSTTTETLATYHFVDFPGSLSTIIFPAMVHILCILDKPSVKLTKKTLDPVAQFQGEESEDYVDTLNTIASQISLCATPIINVNLPAPVAYNTGGGTTLLDQEACNLDQDPTTIQDTIDTPCETMNSELNGKALLDITLPFLTESETIDACDFLYEKAGNDYQEGSAVVDGISVSASDLGKKFKGGVINRISWSYQDSSSFRANISYGSPITGLSSGNLSVYVQATDNALTREGVVVGDKGNGYEYMVSIKSFGIYKAVSMVMADICIGDTVNVTIYNNIAEARF